MFSDRAAGIVRSACAVALLAALGSVACGRKEAPKPPPRKNPARTNDLKASQRGMTLLLTLSYPSTTAGGLALPAIDRVAFARFTRPAPEFMQQPDASAAEAAVEAEAETEDEVAEREARQEAEIVAEEVEAGAEVAEETPGAEDETIGVETPVDKLEEELGEVPETNPYLQIRVDPDEFRKGAENVLVLEGDDLDAAVVGGRIIARFALAEIATEPPVAYSFRAETSAGRLRSPDSNTASFVPLPPPAAPLELTLLPERGGVRLTWSAPEVESDEEIAGFHVYRRVPQASLYPDRLAEVSAEQTEYLDKSARFGSGYVYAVTAVRMKVPLVESALSDEREIAYSDDFAPAAPVDLVLLSEARRTRLVWATSRERDVVGYLVFVSQNGGEPVQLTPEPIRPSEYIHEGTVSGATYTYTVVAVDRTGNRSEPSEEATTRAP